MASFRSVFLAALSLTLAFSAAQAQLTITIDFGSTGVFKETDGVTGTATASGLTDTQKTAIIRIVQREYDDALGLGRVKVSEGTGGDVHMIVNGGEAPGALKGTEYGDAGQPGGPGVVHAGEFTKDGYAGDGLINGIGESVAHEAGHKLGLSHNADEPPSKMTKGPKVSKDQRVAGHRSFTTEDIRILRRNAKLASLPRPTLPTGGQMLGVCLSPPGSSRPKADDNYLDAEATFTGSVAVEYGYVAAGVFVLQGSGVSPARGKLVTFTHTGNYAMVIRAEGAIVPASNIVLTSPNVRHFTVFHRATIHFGVGERAPRLTLMTEADSGTGGFFKGATPSGCRGRAVGQQDSRTVGQ